MSYNIRITYFGIIRSISSWAKVAREIIKALIRKGVEVSIYETKGFLYESDFNLMDLERYISKKMGEIIFTFEHPSKYPLLPKQSFKIGFLVYEFTTLPPLWVENINRYLDMVLVPSSFTYEVFTRSGVEIKKLKILRYGYNPTYYYPTPHKDKIRTFLSISSPHKREATDILLEAFTKAFHNKEDVRLILKLSYLPFKKIKSFEIANFKTLLESYKRILGERLTIISDKLTEPEMARLYRVSDIYISLSKAESFGLCFLEALASNRAVISLRYGGQMDFLNEKNAIFINHKIVESSGDEYEKTTQTQFVAYPEIDDCIEKLHQIYTYGFKPIIDQKTLFQYQWEKIAEEFIRLIFN